MKYVENGWELWQIDDPICDTDWIAVRADDQWTADEIKARYLEEIDEAQDGDDYGTPFRIDLDEHMFHNEQEDGTFKDEPARESLRSGMPSTTRADGKLVFEIIASTVS